MSARDSPRRQCDFVIPDSQSEGSVVSLEPFHDGVAETPPPCAQPSLDTMYHRVVEQSHLKRKAVQQRGRRISLASSPRSPLAGLGQTQPRLQSLIGRPSRTPCGVHALTDFLPSLHQAVDSAKDELIRVEAALVAVEELLKQCGDSCVCLNKHDSRCPVSRSVLGSPFQAAGAGAQFTHSMKEEKVGGDSASSDSDVPLARTNRRRMC